MYDLGDVVTLTVTVTDPAGVPANAGAITCTITLPDATTTSPTPSTTGTGTYAVIYTPPQSGRYTVEWVASGANASAFTDTFSVAAAGIATAGATYSGDPATSDLDQVRFLIHDTTMTAPLFTDSELLWLLDEWGDTYVAAWNATEALVSRYTQLADTSKSIGDLSLSTSYGSKSQEYRALADRLQMQSGRKTSPVIQNTGVEADAMFTIGQFDGA